MKTGLDNENKLNKPSLLTNSFGLGTGLLWDLHIYRFWISPDTCAYVLMGFEVDMAKVTVNASKVYLRASFMFIHGQCF